MAVYRIEPGHPRASDSNDGSFARPWATMEPLDRDSGFVTLANADRVELIGLIRNTRKVVIDMTGFKIPAGSAYPHPDSAFFICPVSGRSAATIEALDGEAAVEFYADDADGLSSGVTFQSIKFVGGDYGLKLPNTAEIYVFDCEFVAQRTACIAFGGFGFTLQDEGHIVQRSLFRDFYGDAIITVDGGRYGFSSNVFRDSRGISTTRAIVRHINSQTAVDRTLVLDNDFINCSGEAAIKGEGPVGSDVTAFANRIWRFIGSGIVLDFSAAATGTAAGGWSINNNVIEIGPGTPPAGTDWVGVDIDGWFGSMVAEDNGDDISGMVANNTIRMLSETDRTIGIRYSANVAGTGAPFTRTYARCVNNIIECTGTIGLPKTIVFEGALPATIGVPRGGTADGLVAGDGANMYFPDGRMESWLIAQFLAIPGPYTLAQWTASHSAISPLLTIDNISTVEQAELNGAVTQKSKSWYPLTGGNADGTGTTWEKFSIIRFQAQIPPDNDLIPIGTSVEILFDDGSPAPEFGDPVTFSGGTVSTVTQYPYADGNPSAGALAYPTADPVAGETVTFGNSGASGVVLGVSAPAYPRGAFLTPAASVPGTFDPHYVHNNQTSFILQQTPWAAGRADRPTLSLLDGGHGTSPETNPLLWGLGAKLELQFNAFVRTFTVTVTGVVAGASVTEDITAEFAADPFVENRWLLKGAIGIHPIGPSGLAEADYATVQELTFTVTMANVAKEVTLSRVMLVESGIEVAHCPEADLCDAEIMEPLSAAGIRVFDNLLDRASVLNAPASFHLSVLDTLIAHVPDLTTLLSQYDVDETVGIEFTNDGENCGEVIEGATTPDCAPVDCCCQIVNGTGIFSMTNITAGGAVLDGEEVDQFAQIEVTATVPTFGSAGCVGWDDLSVTIPGLDTTGGRWFLYDAAAGGADPSGAVNGVAAGVFNGGVAGDGQSGTLDFTGTPIECGATLTITFQLLAQLQSPAPYLSNMGSLQFAASGPCGPQLQGEQSYITLPSLSSKPPGGIPIWPVDDVNWRWVEGDGTDDWLESSGDFEFWADNPFP